MPPVIIQTVGLVQEMGTCGIDQFYVIMAIPHNDPMNQIRLYINKKIYEKEQTNDHS